jgi:hypothetical protein
MWLAYPAGCFKGTSALKAAQKRWRNAPERLAKQALWVGLQFGQRVAGGAYR